MKAGMKKILKEKRRHIFIETNIKDKNKLKRIVTTQYVKLFGLFGLADAHLRFHLKHNIISCNHNEKDKLILVLATISKINNKKVYIHTERVSGTIKSLIGHSTHSPTHP